MIIRDAVPADIQAVTEIYNDAVQRTTSIWNETGVDVKNRLEWLSQRLAAGYPVLVAEGDAGDVLGYASFGDWRPFQGYRYTMEHSVYVRADQRGKGVGKALMVSLIDYARQCGKHVMVAAIEANNMGSVRLHEKLGFRQVGHLPQVGCKFGEWLDLVFMQLILDDRPVP